jgi:DNA-binding Lrp family transcriptional regulator
MQARLAAAPTSLGPGELRFALLNDWQRNFPVRSRPFDYIGARYGVTGDHVIRTLLSLHAAGAVSRVGAVFNIGAGGAGLLCAMTVPPGDLECVAARVSREAEVNHNYEREHRLNLWFVVTSGSPQRAIDVADRIAANTGIEVLRLPMRRAFHIDLGFDLRDRSFTTRVPMVAPREIAPHDRRLAAQLEQGLPLTRRPFEALGRMCDMRESEVLRVLQAWCHDGTLRRFGVIVRHHELGWTCNAMTVFAVPDADTERRGNTLCAHPGITLCYQREPGPGWPYNLYCMVHGRSRPDVETIVVTSARRAGLTNVAHEILFSGRRFKQTGSRYFAEALG